MHVNDPRRKLSLVKEDSEKRALQSLLDIISGGFGFNFLVADGHVVEIQLVACGLSRIPRQLLDFPHLHRLHLENNAIKSFRFLGTINTLQELYLRNNQLTEATNWAELPPLQILDAAENHIQSLLPFASMPSLQFLNLADNQISSIPPLLVLTNLKILNLSSNPIEKLQNIHTLEHLTQVHLQNTKLPPNETAIASGPMDTIKAYCKSQEQA